MAGLGSFFLARKYARALSQLTGNIESLEPIAEFHQVGSVAISEILFSERRPGLEYSKAIIESGHNLLILTNEIFDDAALTHASWLRSLGFSRSAQEYVKVINISHDTPWLRDFFPQPVTIYMEDLPEQRGFVDFRYVNESRIDDTIPYQLGLYFGFSVLPVPLLLDGGNFLTDGESCFLTDAIDLDHRVSRVYSKTLRHSKHGEESREDPSALPEDNGFGMVASNNSEVSLMRRYLHRRVGCKKVFFIRPAAHEHIDMWAKLVNSDTVFVNQISQQTLSLAKEFSASDYERTREIKTILDQAARVFAQHKTVIRIPMPMIESGIFRTYANALLVNKTAFVPRYLINKKTGEPYADQEFISAYENEVSQQYESYGFKVIFIDSDELIIDGGALHCVSYGL